MLDPVARSAIRFTHDPADGGADSITYVLDTTWTAASADGAPAAFVVGLRGVAARVLSSHDLIVETSTRLDRWAAASGVIDLLTIRDTSFWFYVRLRHWLWLEERILWAGIVDDIVREHRPARISCAAGTDAALIDVLRLVVARDRIALDVEAPPEPDPAPEPGATPPPAADSGGVRPAATGLRHSALARLARRVREQFRGPPPPPAWIVRRQRLAERVLQIQALVDAIAADPEPRLLVVHEHARQRVDTPGGPRSMNPYLDPIVDRLRGTRLDPIVLDIRAWAGRDEGWERIGAGHNPRLLSADALSARPLSEPEASAPDDAAPGAAAGTTPGATGRRLDDDAFPDDDAAPDGQAADGEPVVDPVLAAWRDAVDCPIEAFGVDLGPLLAAEVAAVGSQWLPSMTGSIDRIGRFIERIRPAGIVLADEYHRQDWMAAAHAAGVPVAAVQHGMIYPHHNGYIHATRPASLRLPQRTFVFGRWERDLLLRASVYRDDEVVVGGSPRLDLVAPDPGARSAVRRELGIGDDERIVLISGTWGGLYRRFHYPIAVAALADRPLPGVHFVVKLHPGEPDEGPYRRIIETAAAAGGFAPPPITIVQSIDLYRLLAASDAHLGIHSTVLTEAVVTRTPNLLADGLAGADLLGYVAAGVALSVRDGGELLAALDAARAGVLSEAAAAAFTAAHFEPGPASERIAADLQPWLA
jgi:hypothetical protein